MSIQLMPTQQQVVTKTDDDMKSSVLSKMSDEYKKLCNNVKEPWNGQEVIRTFHDTIGLKDVVLIPTTYGADNRVKYAPWYSILSIANMVGGQVGTLRIKTLKAFEFLTIEQLETKIKSLPIAMTETPIIVPEHLKDKNYKRRLFVNGDAVLTLLRHISSKNSPIMINKKDVRNEAKKLLTNMEKLDVVYDGIHLSQMHYNAMPIHTGTITTIDDINTNNLCKEQEIMMREWIITKMSAKLSPFFDRVARPWDRTELLLTNIARLGYTDIILRQEYDDFADEHVYKPYFKLNTLASMLGYSRPNDLIKPSGILSDCTKYYLKSDTVGHRIAPGEGECIIPDSLCMPSDTNKYNCIYINITACETLISSAARIPKFKDSALLFKNLLSDLNRISVVVINRLNQLVAEYRYQQQLTNAHVDQQKILAIEQKERAIEQKQKRLEEEMRIVALQKYPDVDIKKCHHGYIFSSPDDMSRDLFKIGITDDLKGREKSAHTYCPRGNFLYTVDIYDARSAEYTLHQVLKKYGLHRKINSGDEWFYIPGLDEAKKLLDIVASNTNDLYEHVSRYLSVLRDRLCASTTDVPMIEAPPVDPPIDETKLVNDFIREIANKVGMDKPIYKTQLLKMLRDLANDDRYKKHKDKLPTDFDRFTNTTTTTDTATNIDGIKVETKSSGRQTTIRFTIEIITTDDA